MREDRGPGRPRGFDEEAVLQNLLNLFWKKGYEGATLTDLEAATGLGRGSLYAAFGEKEAMYRAAFLSYESRVVDQTVAMLTGPGTIRERTIALLQAAIDPLARDDDRRGCFLCNTAADPGIGDPATRTAAARCFQKLQTALATALRDAAQPQPEAQAGVILAGYTGLRVLVCTGYSVGALEAISASILDASLHP